MKYIIVAITAYLLGSYCASIPITRKFYGDDVRNHGSGNAGATNVARVYGLKAGLLTLACDMAKTVAAMLIGRALCGVAGEALAGAVCITAHCFPLYFGFRGGKGVSVGAALGLMCGWKVFASILAVFFAVAFLSRKVSLGSICASASLPVFAAVFGADIALWLMCIYSAALVIVMHRSNIKRLIAGEEGNFKPQRGRK